MNPLEIRLIAYGILLLIVISAASYATHKLDAAHYESLQAEYSKYQAHVQSDYADAQKAARDALQIQIDAHQRAETNNAQVISTLQTQVDSAQRDAELARSLLALAANTGTAPAGNQLPKTGSGQSASPAGGASGGASLETEVAAAIGECEHNAAQLDALIAEIKPQL